VTIRTLALLSGLVVLAPSRAHAQDMFIGPGSTAEGDILRGGGVFLWGAGQFNYYSAMANSINTDTWMRLNEYIYQSIRFENAEKARRDRISFEKRLANLTKNRDRIANDPNAADIARGEALNSSLMELLKLNPSSYRSNSFPLDSDVVRKIPFFSGQYKADLSLARVNPTERRWPIAMRRPEFAKERRAYELALDTVLDLQGEGKTTRDAVIRLRETAETLLDRLVQLENFGANKILYNEARNYILRLKATAEDMQRGDIEQIYAALDQYSGTTVYDLITFMQKWNLRFGKPDLGDELGLYPTLRATLKGQLDEVKKGVNDRGNEPEPPAPGRRG
jgi:hypothetical protein